MPKIKKLSCDADMFDNSRSKSHVDSNSSNYLTEEINILFYSTYMRGEISSYDKGKFVRCRTTGKSSNVTFVSNFNWTLEEKLLGTWVEVVSQNLYKF